jgi:hypothetical protein
MIYFKSKNPDLGKFWTVLKCKMLVFFAIRSNFSPFGTFYDHLVYFVVIWYIFGHLVYFVAIWYILWSFGRVCGHLVEFVVIWYILWSFGRVCGHLAYFWYTYFTKKNLATVVKGPQMGFIVLFTSYWNTQLRCQYQTDSAAKSVSAPFYSTVRSESRDQSWSGHVTKVLR